MSQQSRFEDASYRRATEAVLLASSLFGGMVAVWIGLFHDGVLGMIVLFLSLLLFGLSRLLDLGVELSKSVARLEIGSKSAGKETAAKESEQR